MCSHAVPPSIVPPIHNIVVTLAQCNSLSRFSNLTYSLDSQGRTFGTSNLGRSDLHNTFRQIALVNGPNIFGSTPQWLTATTPFLASALSSFPISALNMDSTTWAIPLVASRSMRNTSILSMATRPFAQYRSVDEHFVRASLLLLTDRVNRSLAADAHVAWLVVRLSG